MRYRWAFVLVAVTLFLSNPARTQEPDANAASPLDLFGALAVGAWESGGSRHELEWGVGERVIRSRSYFLVDDRWELVSEGLWYQVPGETGVRGVVVATGMPVEVFEYRSEVNGQRVLHDLTGHGPAGGRFVERWTFDGGSYTWDLEQTTGGTTERLMGGSYRRVGP